MSEQHWEHLKKLFHAALQLNPEQRDAFLNRACVDNPSMRSQVEGLIQSHEKTGSFIDSPALEAATELLAIHPQFKPGDLIAHYQIRLVLGEGGMGTVYLAEDSKLQRKVALKILPGETLVNDDGRKRFLREARTAAALDHPNICAIYEVGEDNGNSYIAMQYLEGETLDVVMARRSLSLAEIFKIAIQVADALSDAHARNIIHRDIKPSNLMLTSRGEVKVLDFGLAKVMATQTTPEAATTADLTQPGLIIGTVPYMSPEQARGIDVDTRTDVWSFGVVLYQMIAGKLPFTGESNTDTLAEILRKDPAPLTDYAPDTPAELSRIVGKMLRKNSDERYQSTKDALVDLKVLRNQLFSQESSQRIEEVHTSELKARDSASNRFAATDGGRSVTESSTSVRTRFVLLISMILIAIAGVATGLVLWKSSDKQDARDRPAMLQPVQVTTWNALDIHPALSPDGNAIAYSSDHGGNFEIYVKPLLSGGREIQLTSDRQQNFEPTWSPDGQRIAYYSRNRGGIWVVPASGGMSRQVSQFGSNPSWSPDGSLIAFQSNPLIDLGAQATAAVPPSTIWTVPSNGSSEPTAITKIGNPTGGHGAPKWSPDGSRILFSSSDVVSSIWGVSSHGGDAYQLINSALDAVYSPDSNWVYYAALSGVWKVRISKDRGIPEGEPIQLTSSSMERIRHLTVSADGKKIAYTALWMKSDIWSVPVDPKTATASGPAMALTQDRSFRNSIPSFSPDGKRIVFNTQAVNRGDGEGDLRLMDADGRNLTQLTTEGAGHANWFPDGEQLVFIASRREKGRARILNMKTGQDKLLLDFGEDVRSIQMSPDGKQISFNSRKSGTFNISVIPVSGGEAKQLTFDKEAAGYACWSPDGKTLAFEVQRGDDTHIFTMASDGGEITQLTFDKGQSWPQSFSPDGNKIAFAGFRNGIWNVWWVSRSTKEQKQVTNYTKLNTYVRYPAWSPLGNQIVYEFAETTGNIWIADLK